VPLVSGCGAVEFVPSPFTPQKVELIYSAQEDMTIVRWRISSDDPSSADLSFAQLGDTGYTTIDFSQSVYPGGGGPCADGSGSCFQYVFRGPAPSSWGSSRPIQGVHTKFGVLPGGLPIRSTVTTTVSLASFFSTANDTVYVNITDTVAQDGAYVFPRTYERTIWPTKGLCLSDTPPDGVEFSALYGAGGFPAPSPLTDDGMYCVGIRPVPTDAGAAALAQTRVETQPEVTDLLHLDYVPTIQKSPVIYQIILDLSIPVASRCDSAIMEIESAVNSAMQGAGVPFVQLDEINLALDPTVTDDSAKCAQMTTGRAFDADALAAKVQQTITSFPETYQQFHLFYFNNLDAPLPSTLLNSLQRLSDDLGVPPPGYQLQTISFGFDSGLATVNGPTWTMPEPWFTSVDVKMLTQTLDSYAQQSLPYQSQIYNQYTPIPFLTPDQLTQYAGGQLKLCDYTTGLAAVDTTKAASLGNGPTYPINAADPPAFLAFVNPPVNKPADAFAPVSVGIDMQVCTRFCSDHPFVTLAGTGQDSWTQSVLCATQP
jgi:hypothetical protein